MKKHDLKRLLAVITALGLPVAAHAAETLTQAQITQIIKDVKTIDPAKGSHAAIMKETLQGDQSVRTGLESRTELLFNDHTITRLGANTHFSFSEGTRNMSLQSGVMLLQVPKGIGGAKIETAAVTAAVTGTTIMVEAGKDYTKLIVLEGECCLWPKNDKKDNKFFKFKHKMCALAGQEIILRNGAKTIPDPIYVNLKLLETTSLLITGNWGSPLNGGPIQAAAAGQGPDDFIPTNLAIVGAGTDVTVIVGELPQTPPPPGTPPNSPPPGKYGPLPTIPGGPFTIGGGASINTDPKIIRSGIASYGRIYRGPLFDGSASSYFGANGPNSFSNSFSDIFGNSFPNYGVVAFKFSSLNLTAMPSVVMSGNGANDLALISEGNINVNSAATQTTLDFSQFYDVLMATVNGNINIGANIDITGVNGLFQLAGNGAGKNINIDGTVDIGNGQFVATTQGSFTGDGTINAGNVTIQAGGSFSGAENITAVGSGGEGSSGSINIQTGGSFGGTGSFDAESVTVQAAGIVSLDETTGEGQTDAVNGVSLNMDSLFELSLTGNTVKITNGFTFPGEDDDTEVDLSLTARSNGADQLGDITLSGNIVVDSLTASADHNFTADSSSTIASDNDVSINAGGKVELDGEIDATSLEIGSPEAPIGGSVTTGSNAGISVESEGDASIQINASGDVTLDGNISAGELDVTGDNVTLLSTEEESSISINNTFQITASGSVQIEGTIFASDLNVTQSTGVVVTDSATINADTIELTSSGSVEIDGVVQGGDGSASSFTSTSTGAQGADDPSTQDFFGTGSIDAQTITINSAGDLILDDEGLPTVNGVSINPNSDLTELDLTGATIEVTNGYNVGTTLNLTTTNGDITIGDDINLGVGGDFTTQFSANSSGNIVFTNDSVITADTVSLTGGQITSPADPTINAGNITLNVSNANFALTQESPSSTTFFVDETDTDDVSEIGSFTLNLNGSGPAITVSANSLTVGNISGPSDLSLTLISANDINAESSATIDNINSLALQVGVVATLAGDGNANISYNGGQLNINGSTLSSFSVTAPEINVNENFPTSLPGIFLNLYSYGLSTGITVNTSLDIGSGNFTAVIGGISVEDITTESGGLTLTADNGNITVNGALQTADGQNLTLEADNGAITTQEGATLTTGTNGALSVTATGTVTLNDAVTTGSGGNMIITSSNSDVVVNNTLNSGGTLNITGNNVTTSSSVTTAGDLTINANNGDLLILGNLSVGGNFTGSASGDLTIEATDPTISGFMNLNAGGVLEIDEDINISGDLTLSGGTNIHSFNNSTIFGATNVTLTLSAAAEISETTGDGSTLFFGVPSANEDEGAGPIAISLTDVISNEGFINATATSLTLTSNFDESNIDLTLTANGGNLTLNGNVTANSFTGSASNIINGSGSITAGSVSLQQGGAATVTESVDNSTLSFGTVSITLFDGEVGATSLALSAGPLTLGGDLDLTGIDLTLFGSVNAQGHAITAQNVILANLSTVISGGNATNFTINASTLTLEGVSLNGSTGNGGIFSGTTAIVEEGGFFVPQAINQNFNNIEVDGPLTADGGSSKGNGGTITLNSAGNVDINEFAGDSFVNGYVSASGGNGGGNGGTINLLTSGGDINVDGGVIANGGDVLTGATAGGNGGAINLNSSGDINVDNNITANGGGASPAGGAGGGNGGTVSLIAAGNINVESNITASTGINGNSKWTGGNGGTVSLTAQGEVTVNSTVEVSSSDLVHNRVSAKGGNINVTSHATTGVAINITDSGQLNALLNQAAAGPGGTITFVADSGGSVDVSGQVRADHGTINIQNQAASGAVNINSGASLSADVVKVGALGTNGTLNISGGTINGDTAIKLYAAGDNGSVVFSGNTSLTGASLKSIAGNIVTINNGVFVNVTGGAATVYTNTPNYTGAGGNASTTGAFSGNTNTTTKPFASRPAF